MASDCEFDAASGAAADSGVMFKQLPKQATLTLTTHHPGDWLAMPSTAAYDLDNIVLAKVEVPPPPRPPSGSTGETGEPM